MCQLTQKRPIGLLLVTKAIHQYCVVSVIPVSESVMNWDISVHPTNNLL